MRESWPSLCEAPEPVEFRVTITMEAPADRLEQQSEHLLDGLRLVAPRTGPVTGADLADHTLDATFSFPEESADRAVARAMVIFRKGVKEGGLQLRRIVAVEAAAIAAEELKQGPALAGAAPGPAP